MSSLNSNAMVTLLNSSTLSGVVTLPLTTDIPFRTIMFKDFNGYTSGASTITLSTLGTDTFENGSSRYVLSNAYESLELYADTYHNKWITLNSYKPYKYVQWVSQSIKFLNPVLLAPTINWNATYTDNAGLHIYWNPVVGATSYKVFGSRSYPWINNYTINDATILSRSLGGPCFDYDSGPITSNNFDIQLSVFDYNFYVYAYNNSSRSLIPTTQLYYQRYGYLELWPTVVVEFLGGSNYHGFTEATITNRYTGETYTNSSNYFSQYFPDPNLFPFLPEIHTNVPISNK